MTFRFRSLPAQLPHCLVQVHAALLLLCLLFPAPVAQGGEAREWNDKSGKFSVTAEIVDTDAETVSLKTADGKTLDVPKAKLSENDLEFVDQFEAKKAHEVKVRFAATRFFNALKKADEERDEEVMDVITAGAREKMSGSGSEIKNLPKPDRAAKPAVRSIVIEGDTAEAIVRLRFKGKSITPTLMLRREGEDWLIYGITGPDEEDEITTILFEDEKSIEKASAAADGMGDSSEGDADGAQSDAEDATFNVPTGGVSELLEFMQSALASKPDDDADESTHHQQLIAAVEEAANAVVRNKDAKETQKTQAGQYLIDAIMLTSGTDPEGTADRVAETAEELSRRELTAIAPYAEIALLQIRLDGASSEDDLRSLVADALVSIESAPLHEKAVLFARRIGKTAESIDTALAIDTYEKLAETFKSSGTFSHAADKCDALIRRLKLIGNEMKVAGVTPAGEPFVREEYKGKVILVDFWATWCASCREELPNVLANYEQFHDKGFEVVAISLDDDLTKLESYLEEATPPWVVLADQHPKNKGESIAEFYGIESIPAAVLIGTDGKVISMDVRGTQLGTQLERLLGGDV